LSEFGDALQGHKHENLKAVIMQDWRYTSEARVVLTWRLYCSAFRECDGVNSEMHFKAVIEHIWRCTWRP
jgi:hypothetical protein